MVSFYLFQFPNLLFMGKDKPAKPAPDAKVVADDKSKPIARGHKQRGAGTVITAKAAVVTEDGIVLKAHEVIRS